MAPAGFVTHMHYDIFDNWYLQVDGTKRFDLASPALHAELSIYPMFHERTRLARVQVTADSIVHDSNTALSSIPLTAIQRVDLQPGDLLFIPAFTYHQVCLATLLSLNP